MIAVTNDWIVMTEGSWAEVIRHHPIVEARHQPYQTLRTTLYGRCVCVVETLGM